MTGYWFIDFPPSSIITRQYYFVFVETVYVFALITVRGHDYGNKEAWWGGRRFFTPGAMKPEVHFL